MCGCINNIDVCFAVLFPCVNAAHFFFKMSIKTKCAFKLNDNFSENIFLFIIDRGN